MGATRSHLTLMQLVRISGGSDSKASAYNVGDPGSIPGSGRSSGEGNGNPLQYSYLENPMDGGVWWATVYGVPKSWTQLSNFTLSLQTERVVGRKQPAGSIRLWEMKWTPGVLRSVVAKRGKEAGEGFFFLFSSLLACF